MIIATLLVLCVCVGLSIRKTGTGIDPEAKPDFWKELE